MIPHTYPSELNPYSDQSEMKVYYLSSISGLVRWTDYIPVQTKYWDTGIEGTTDATGYQAIQTIASTTGLSAWSDYVPVYEDGAATVPWTTDANGYIPIGFSESGVLSFLDGAEFIAPLTHSLVLDEGTGTATFTRATTATVTDNEGVLRTCLAGEARFTGARRVRNLWPVSSENIGAMTTANAGAAAPTVTLNQTTAPDGTLTADKIVFPAVTAGQVSKLYNSTAPAYAGRTILQSIYLKGDVGGEIVNLISSNGAYATVTATLTTAWQRFNNLAYTATAASYLQIGFETSAPGTQATSGVTVYAWGVQQEDITGRTDQTTPSEYVSVGVLSAPLYHGSGVDGVACFDYYYLD